MVIYKLLTKWRLVKRSARKASPECSRVWFIDDIVVDSKDEFDALDDLLDFESIELLDEDFNDIVSIRKLSDSTADKLTFTIFLSNVMLTAFLAGYVPQYFYYWHSVVRNETACNAILHVKE